MEEEERYQQALALYECLGCMNACDDKIIIVKGLAKEFEQLGEYKEASKYAVICKKAITKTKKDKVQFLYEQAILHLKRAQTLDGYQKVLKEFEELDDYKDSSSYREECSKKINEISKKESRKFRIGAILTIVILIAFVALQTPVGKYYKANAYMKVRLYEHAGKLYNTLAGYKDSKVRYQECEYQVGVRAIHKKDYEKAEDALVQANNRKDSNALLVQVQKKILEKKEIGNKIKIGNSTWIILDKQLDKVQLIKKSAIKNVDYSQIERSNWEHSDVRTWLNGEYLESDFTPEECANMVSINYSKSGEEFMDKISLLGVEELTNYGTIKLGCSTNQWLRDTIAETNNALFLNKDGVVMEAGYPVDSNQFSIRPIFWYLID